MPGLLDAYRQNIGDPFAQLVGGAGRGYLGLGVPAYANSMGMDAYRTGQALSNMPGLGAPAGLLKAAANAPEALVAMGGLLGKGVGKLAQVGENAANISPINTRSNHQSGMALFDIRGLPNGGRDLIRSEADGFAKTLADNGFQVNVEHSGSIAGPSSYLSIYDPETGRSFSKQIRMSGHDKGPYNSQGILNVSTAEEKASVFDEAIKMRGLGPSEGLSAIAARQDKTREYWTSIYEKAQGKLAGNQKLSNNEQKAIDWVSKNSGQPK
jgi:hypothetical protein